MVRYSECIRPLALRLLAVVFLLGWPQIGSAAGTWSVLSSPQKPGEVFSPAALTVDAAGNLYTADNGDVNGRIQRRDAHGHWSVIATHGSALGQVDDTRGLAVDTDGNLYVADTGNNRVQEYTLSGGQ